MIGVAWVRLDRFGQQSLAAGIASLLIGAGLLVVATRHDQALDLAMIAALVAPDGSGRAMIGEFPDPARTA